MEREPVKIFYCYAREDEALRDRLAKHLEPLRREGLITTWYDREISAGKDFLQEILLHLNSSDIFLALISPAFMSSTYCYDTEMSHALEKQILDGLRVIPVILRPVDWTHTPLGKSQALPQDGIPITEWKTIDRGLQDVAKGIRKAVGELQETKPAYDSAHYTEIGNFWNEILTNEMTPTYWAVENIGDEHLKDLIIKEAYQAFKLAARLDPENCEAWEWLSRYSSQLGENKVTLLAYDKLLQNLTADDDWYWNVYYSKILLLERLGQHEEAQEMKIRYNQYMRATYTPNHIQFHLFELQEGI